jgi:hypothetical protein
MSVKHQRVKFWLLKTNLKALAKKKKTKGQVWRENEWKEERNGEKKKSV